MMEDKKAELPVLMTPDRMQLKITGELSKIGLTLSQLQERALNIVKNRDNLPIMRDLKEDIKKGRDVAEESFQQVKKPYWDAGKACDAGKKLVFDEFARIEGMFDGYYSKELKAIADEKRLQDLKIAQTTAILKGIETNLITLSQKIVAAVTTKQILEVESLINLQKSPSMAKKYGEYHEQAIARFDEVLMPILRDKKAKIKEIEEHNRQLAVAEANNDPDAMEKIDERINELSDGILQNNANVEEAALNQEFFPVEYATEVLPDVKTKRTNYSFAIADLDVAIKKSRHLLEIGIDNKLARNEMDVLHIKEMLKDKDEVVVNGIKYIATKVREAL